MTATTSDGLLGAKSVKATCNVIGISRSKLYQEIAAGRLRAVKCGSRTLVLNSAIKTWLDSLPAKAD